MFSALPTLRPPPELPPSPPSSLGQARQTLRRAATAAFWPDDCFINQTCCGNDKKGVSDNDFLGSDGIFAPQVVSAADFSLSSSNNAT
ncbi:hypothetical protein MPC4_30014 [Methylocella tundrae]|uniref:Uncharacterized protein n=1 Tax=Methylocella tundrae TaxID=227605 RepID=A0A8B6M7H2_METTU|nr:hypothetical protein MPC4_30014 [Methylocella tundrae]